eukprot:1929955-Prymnesium_polylepis.1
MAAHPRHGHLRGLWRPPPPSPPPPPPPPQSAAASALTVPFIDLFPFNDEVDMLDYRLRLHASFVDTFVIVETGLTYSGEPKPLHAHEALLRRANSHGPPVALNLTPAETDLVPHLRRTKRRWVEPLPALAELQNI